MDQCLTWLNENVWKRHIDHVKIDSDDSAAEVAKEKEDCDLASPEIFRRLNRLVLHRMLPLEILVNPVYCLPRHKLFVDHQDNADPQID